MVAILGERAAIEQSDRFDVPSRDTMWRVMEAYKKLYQRDRNVAVCMVDDLLATGMPCPWSQVRVCSPGHTSKGSGLTDPSVPPRLRGAQPDTETVGHDRPARKVDGSSSLDACLEEAGSTCDPHSCCTPRFACIRGHSGIDGRVGL